MASNKIGLFFGSFNPIHNGHLMIANYMAEFSDLDQVWFVISPLNPFKNDAELLADYHRRELLMRAISDYPRFKVSSVEFKLPKPSFTIDTLDFLEQAFPDKQFTLIMGSDQLPDFHLWKNPDKILEKYKILVYPRPEGRDMKHETHEMDARAIPGFPGHASRVTFIDAPMMEVSSSFIRQSIKKGKDVRFYMPELSWQYIDEMHFYR